MSTTAARNRIAGAVLVLAANALVFASTGFAQGSAPETTLQSTVWRWVHSVLNDDTLVTPIDRDRYTVAFGADDSLSVRADCNQVSGTYRQNGRRLSLQLGPSTRVACAPGSRADEFLQQLGAVVSQVSTETMLVLNLRLDSGSMVFEPQPALSLSGTTWQVLSYNNGLGAVTTPLVDTDMTAVFRTDGIISGSSGCNTYSGSYTADERSLSIGAVATTHLVCDEAIMDQEQAYLAALQASTQYELAADRLTLRNNDGAIQVDSLSANPSK